MDSLAGLFQAFFKTRQVSYNSTPIKSKNNERERRTTERQMGNDWLLSSHRCICSNRKHYTRYILMTPEAEKFNGWMAMLGFVAAMGAYITTGQIIPGIF